MLLCELTLEYRHYHKGFNTPIFGVKEQQKEKSNSKKNGQSHEYGPSSVFPFRSRIIEKNKKDNVRIWIASASHAEHITLPQEEIFPNKICDFWVGGCEVLNGSKAGMSIPGNIDLLNKYVKLYRPDFSVLYQMSLIIEYQQGALLNNIAEKAIENRNSIFDISHIKAFLQTTSAYQHLSDYIGGNLKLEGFLKNRLPKTYDSDFELQIMSFLETSKQNGVQPVLTTFAASHDTSNLSDMPLSIRTNFVRYNSYLSPLGWVTMIKHYNDLVREIASREGAFLIDIESEMNGKSWLFVDFVHFNPEGHRLLAIFLAQKLQVFASRSNTVNEIKEDSYEFSSNLESGDN